MILKRSPKRTNLNLSPKAHPIVRAIALRMFAEKIVERDACRLAGFNGNTFGRWKRATAAPDLFLLEALAEVVGLRIVIKDAVSEIVEIDKEKPRKHRAKKPDAIKPKW
jgi:hypothetical protein